MDNQRLKVIDNKCLKMVDNKRSKVGIMGGTFDPIHIGHLILGENAYHQFKLDKVLYMPSGNPPHKQERKGRASVEERTKMTALAIADNPHFELCTLEAGRTGFSYTSDTLRELATRNPNTEYYFIMGADSLYQFENWWRPQQICDLCTILVAVREDISKVQMENQLKSQIEQQMEKLKQMYNGRFLKLEIPNINISSDELRKHIAAGHSLRYYMPEIVADYINQNSLYKERE